MSKKIIYLDIEDDNMYSGMDAISFVDEPATQIDWHAFNKQEKEAKKKELFTTNMVQRIVTSPVMLAETEIYRYSQELGEYYVKFSAETIRRMRNKYMMEGKQNMINLNHDATKRVQDVFMVESYITGDKVKSELFDVPDGTWIASFYIANDKYWNEFVMSGEFNGFSLEGAFIENYESMNLEKKKDLMKEIMESEKHDLVKLKLIEKILTNG